MRCRDVGRAYPAWPFYTPDHIRTIRGARYRLSDPAETTLSTILWFYLRSCEGVHRSTAGAANSGATAAGAAREPADLLSALRRRDCLEAVVGYWKVYRTCKKILDETLAAPDPQ